MSAVAPQSHRLSPFVGTLRAEVARAVADVLGRPELIDATLERRGDRLWVHGSDGDIELGGVSPADRQAGRRLEVRVHGGASVRRAVTAALAAPGVGGRLRELAARIDAWWPFSELDDEEFRKVSSSPHGAYATLRLGYRCNQDCWFCWQDRQAPSPPMARYWLWLEELTDLGVDQLNLTGGEATTWPELPELIAAAAARGMQVSLQSNAIRLSRPGYAQKLADAGLKAVMVSLHAPDPEVSDAMTRAPGTHARTVAGIHAALDAGLVVTLTCVVEQANHAHLVEHARFVRDELVARHPGGGLARVTYAHPTSYFEPGSWADHQVPFGQVRPQLSRAVALLRAAGVPVQVGGPCGFPVCALDPDLVPDPYEVLEKTVFTPEELVHRRFAETCTGCVHRPRCFGLREEYLERFGGEGLVPVRA